MNKSAAIGQKKLPGELFSDPATEDTHTNQGQGTKMPEPLLTGNGSGIHPLNFSSFTGRSEAFAQSASAAGDVESRGVTPVDYVVQEIGRNAFQLRQLGAGQMQVVLKPDSNTELALHLSLRNGIVEVQAQFDQGNSAAVNVYWKELRFVLAQQGVHLMPLRETPSPVTHSPHSDARWFDHSGADQRSAQERPSYYVQAETPAEHQTVGARSGRVGATASQRAAGRWESWA